MHQTSPMNSFSETNLEANNNVTPFQQKNNTATEESLQIHESAQPWCCIAALQDLSMQPVDKTFGGRSLTHFGKTQALNWKAFKFKPMPFRPREERKLAQVRPRPSAAETGPGTSLEGRSPFRRYSILSDPTASHGSPGVWPCHPFSPGSRGCTPRPPYGIHLFPTRRKTRGGVLGGGAGRGGARRRSGRQVGPRRRPAPHLMQSAFRNRVRRPRSRRKRSCALPSAAAPPPAPGFRASSPSNFAWGGGRHSASRRGRAERVGNSSPGKAKFPAALIVTWKRPPNVSWLQQEIPLIMYFQKVGGGREWGSL